MTAHRAATSGNHVVLRTRAQGGLAELPHVVTLLTAEGPPLPVPADEIVRDGSGALRLRGEAHGFAARLTLDPRGDEPAYDAALTVDRVADRALAAGLRVELRLGAGDDPGWLVPGAFYGENRRADCTRPYPRYHPDPAECAADPTGLTASAWSLRADRCATPAVFARDAQGGAALATSEYGPLGEQGVGFADDGGRAVLRLHFPYREEPVSYYGSGTPRPADTPTHHWQPGEQHTLRFTVHLHDSDPHAYAPVIRALHQAFPAHPEPAAWTGVEEAAQLSAEGLHRWHYRADPPVLLETAAFDREALGERGDRPAMHVSWVSGTPYAHALLLHARRVGDETMARDAAAVIDHICANLTPGGTFWGQWSASGAGPPAGPATGAACTPARWVTPPCSRCAPSPPSGPAARTTPCGTGRYAPIWPPPSPDRTPSPGASPPPTTLPPASRSTTRAPPGSPGSPPSSRPPTCS